jgi:competence protein ComEC
MLLLATASVLGVLVADDLLPADAGRLLLLAGMLLVLALAGSLRAAAVALAAAALAIGASAAAIERAAYDAVPLRAWVSSTSASLTWLEGIAREDGRLHEGELVVTLDVLKASVGGRVVSMPGRARVHIAGRAHFPDVAGGDRVALWTELRVPGGFRNPGSPDLAAQARTEGIHAVGRCKSARLVSVVTAASAGVWQRTAAHARRWSHEAIVAALPEGPERAVVLAMTLGEQTAVDPRTAESFRIAGTYHVLALSGAQVALVAGILIVSLRRVGLGPLARAAAVTPALAFYAAVVGEGVSITRAVVMALLALWARVIDADVDLANVLGTAAAAMLVAHPSVIDDVGFQLTFAATLGILLLVPVLKPYLPALPWGIDSLIAASLAAQLALTPLTAAQFHRLTPAALALNLAAVPLASAVLLAGAAILPVAALSSTGAMWSAAPAWFFARLLLLSGEIVRAVPALDMRVPAPGLVVIVLYAGGIAALMRRRFVPAAVLIVVALVRMCSPVPVADGRLHVTALDVGQGDAIVIETPAGHAWLVDAGNSANGFDLGELAVAPYLWWRGITSLEGIVVSHAHLDHVGGVPFLLRHFQPKQLWEGPAPRRDAGYALLDAAARDAPVLRISVRRGVVTIIDGVRLEVLGPAGTRTPPAQTRNDDSVVVRVSWGDVSFLLTGDIEAPGEQALGAGPTTVLKVAHHGSHTSSSERFLDATRPRIALLSVGARNHFGHPSPDVLRRYALHRTDVYRTDQDGAITVSTDGRRVWVKPGGI